MLRITRGVRSTHDPDGAVILDVLHGRMFRLNFVGSKILELLKQGRTEQEISHKLAGDFSIDLITAEVDVREFMATLERNQLLSVRDNDFTA